MWYIRSLIHLYLWYTPTCISCYTNSPAGGSLWHWKCDFEGSWLFWLFWRRLKNIKAHNIGLLTNKETKKLTNKQTNKDCLTVKLIIICPHILLNFALLIYTLFIIYTLYTHSLTLLIICIYNFPEFYHNRVDFES